MISSPAFAFLRRATGPLDETQLNIYDLIPFQVSANSGWFSVKPDTTNVNGYGLLIDDNTILGGQYYKNDQTFFSAGIITDSVDNVTILSGSYLFDVGLFVGVKNFSSSSSSTILFPGYRLNIDDKSYIAGMLYLNLNSSSDVLAGYNIHVKYYADKLFVNGEASYISGMESFNFKAGVNYQILDSLTAGLSYLSMEGDSAYEVGATWGEESGILINGVFGQDVMQNTYYGASGMFAIGDHFAVGGQYDVFNTSSSSGLYQVKGEYRTGKFKVGLSYLNSTTSLDSGAWFIGAKMNLQ
jgi:hypothetical protein